MKIIRKAVKEEKSISEARSRKGRSARAKGASFERDVAKLIGKRYGISLTRTPMSGGFAKNKDWYSFTMISITYEFSKRCRTCHYVE